MILNKDIQMGDVMLQLRPMPVREVLKYDRKIVGIVAPVIGDFFGVDPESVDPNDITRIATAFATQLNSLPDSEYLPMMESMLSTVTFVAPGMAPAVLTADNWDSQLSGRGSLLIYKIIVEVVKYNKFLPFAAGELLSIIGKETPKTAGSMPQKPTMTISSETSAT